jgi:small subunit ribosomal protein S12e
MAEEDETMNVVAEEEAVEVQDVSLLIMMARAKSGSPASELGFLRRILTFCNLFDSFFVEYIHILLLLLQAQEELGTIDALKVVLKTALAHDGLRRGLHECTKALDRGAGQLCILAQDCDNDEITKLVKALCQEGSTSLIMADESKELAEWCGLCKLNEDGTVKKAVKCAVVVVTDYGAETPAKAVVEKYVESMQ